MQSLKTKHKTLQVISLLCLGVSNVTYAYSQFSDTNWHGLIAIGAGAASSTTIGESKNFPINESGNGEFYNYTANKGTQTSALFEGFIGAEYYLFPAMIQIGFDYSQTTPYTAKGTLVQGATVATESSWKYHYSFYTRQILFEGKFLLTLANIVHPYLLAGAGSAFNKTYNYSTNAPDTTTRLYKNNDASGTFSYSLGAGIDVDISSKLRLGIGYRFSDLGTVKLNHASINGRNVQGTLSQSSLYTNALLAQLTWLM